MTTKLSDFVREGFIAPSASDVEAKDIPEMSDFHSESRYWVTNHFLNSVGRARLKGPVKAYVYNYLRRAEGAFLEHEQARQATMAFVASDRQSPSLYASALLHWEFFLGQSWQGLALLAGLFELLSEEPFRTFEPNDGSVEQRLHSLYNSMKHVESRIAAGQIEEGATVPVWLTNEGIKSTDTLLFYYETAETLRDVAKWADIVVDPLDMARRLQENGS